MPHIVVEYTNTVADHVDVSVMLAKMHGVLAEMGVEKARIKTRGIALDHAIVGDFGAEGEMLHATVSILDGRDLETKNRFAETLHEVMKEAVAKDLSHCSVTLEVREMDRETYCL